MGGCKASQRERISGDLMLRMILQPAAAESDSNKPAFRVNTVCGNLVLASAGGGGIMTKQESPCCRETK